MTKRHKESLWFAFLFTFVVSVMLSGSAQAQAGLDDQGPPEPPVVVLHDETGYASFISAGELGELELPDVIGRSVRPGQLAFAYLEVYGSYFGLRDARTELELITQDLTPQNNNFRYQQVFRGVPVMVGELIVNTSVDGGLRSMSGEVSPELALDVKPAILPAEAAQTALGVIAKDHNVPLDSLEASEPELWIYDEQLLRPSERPVELVWQMDIASTAGAPIRELVLINARTGGVSLHFNQIDTLWHDLAWQQEDVPEPTPTPEPTVEPAVEPTVEPTQEPATEPTAEPALDTVPQADGLTFYVATTGDDLYDCATPATPCATIQAAVDKASSGDTIKLAGGDYHGSGDPVVFIDKNLNISGDWAEDFSDQTGYSVIFGDDANQAIRIEGVDGFPIHVGMDQVHLNGGKIEVLYAGINLSHSSIENAPSNGINFHEFTDSIIDTVSITGTIYFHDNSAAIRAYTYQFSQLLIKNSVLYNNNGSGLRFGFRASVVIQNTTIAGNYNEKGGGIRADGGISGASLNIINSTIVDNTAKLNGGGLYLEDLVVNLQNTIISGNHAPYPADSDCFVERYTYPEINSLGYNIVSIVGDCPISPNVGDHFYEEFPILTLGNYGGNTLTYPVLINNLALDAGNPATPVSSPEACLETDQRGLLRPIDGDGDGSAVCDIGAVEYQGNGTEAAYLVDLMNAPRLKVGQISPRPILVGVLDAEGRGVPGVSVSLTSPNNGPSGTFITSGTNAVTVVSDSNGIADAGFITANQQLGEFSILVESDIGLDNILIVLRNLPGVETYDMNNDSDLSHLPGDFWCDQYKTQCSMGKDFHADFAQINAINAISYYWDHHARKGIDDAWMDVISSVHFDSEYNNAFWNGEQMVYGDAKQYPLAEDVVAHELTHGVTEHESNLFYYYQSGAINESFSDLWGEFFDLSSPNFDYSFEEYYRWRIGERVGIGRSMKDPTAYKDPDKMTSPYYYREPGDYYYTDNGGVHTNSGVNNKAVYLMTDGDTFNGYTVTGIGMDKVGAIYYEVNTNLLTSGADYKDLYYAVQQACKTLTGGAEGISAADCVELQKALDAVEMSLDPVANYNPDPPACPVGYEPKDIFYDGFETDTGKWNFQNIAGIGKTWGRDTGAAAEGSYSLYGPDYQGVDAEPDLQGLATYVSTDNIAIPSGTVYLHFEHMFGFEDPNWDGGQLQYSVNNSGWQNASGLFQAGVNYNGTVSADYGSQNPIRNQQAFIMDSHGYVSSKYNLSSFSGSNLRFRWLIGTDIAYYDLGWILDEVRVYKCVERQYGAFTAPGNSGNLSQPRAWIKVAPSANAGEVVSVEFQAKYSGSWHLLYTDTDGSDGWGYQWSTLNLPDAPVDIVANVSNSDGQTFPIQMNGLTPTYTQYVGNVGTARSGESVEAFSENVEAVEAAVLPLVSQPVQELEFSWWRTELSLLKKLY